MCRNLYGFCVSDQKVILSKRHRAVGKESSQTNHVERLNNTFRQHISRLERESIFLQKSGKSYWRDLVLYTRLQCQACKGLSFTTTIESLPKNDAPQSWGARRSKIYR
jgi:hypothetical protein